MINTKSTLFKTMETRLYSSKLNDEKDYHKML